MSWAHTRPTWRHRTNTESSTCATGSTRRTPRCSAWPRPRTQKRRLPCTVRPTGCSPTGSTRSSRAAKALGCCKCSATDGSRECNEPGASTAHCYAAGTLPTSGDGGGKGGNGGSEGGDKGLRRNGVFHVGLLPAHRRLNQRRRTLCGLCSSKFTPEGSLREGLCRICATPPSGAPTTTPSDQVSPSSEARPRKAGSQVSNQRRDWDALAR